MSENANHTVEVPGLMSDDEILAAYAGKSTRGIYEIRTLEWNASDEAGVEPAKMWPMDFGDKTVSALVQSFRNAIAKHELTETVELVQRDGRVFLFNTERVRLIRERKAAEAAASNGHAA